MKLKHLLFTNIITMVLALCVTCVITGGIGSIFVPYVLNTWLIFSGGEATVTAFNGFLIGLFPPAGILSIPASIATWIIMLFL